MVDAGKLSRFEAKNPSLGGMLIPGTGWVKFVADAAGLGLPPRQSHKPPSDDVAAKFEHAYYFPLANAAKLVQSYAENHQVVVYLL